MASIARPGSTPRWAWLRGGIGAAPGDPPTSIVRSGSRIIFSQDLPKHFTSGFPKYVLNHWTINGMFVVQSGTTARASPMRPAARAWAAPIPVPRRRFTRTWWPARPDQSRALTIRRSTTISTRRPGVRRRPARSATPAGTCCGDRDKRNLDFSVFRGFPIRERLNLEFRVEFFNITNHPNFGNPNISMDSASFGQISTTLTNARIIQFAMKMMF